MNDFLTRLTRRTLGLAPLVQPRIPPMFAPETSPAPDVVLEETERIEGSASATEPSHLPTPADRPQSLIPRDASRFREKAAAPEGAAEASEEEVKPSVARPASSPWSTDVDTEREEAGLLVPVPETPRATVGRSAQPARRATGVGSDRPVAVSPRTSRESTRPADAADDMLRLPPSPPAAAAPGTRGTPAAPAPSSAENPPRRAEPAPPTITITIGRVEVRAVQAPAPPQPRPIKRSAPLLSLEEYLRRQSGGKP